MIIPGFYYDIYYFILVIPAMIFAMAAQARVSSVFKKYSSFPVSSGMTGLQAAEIILRGNGIDDVSISMVSGNLNDHFDPRNKNIALSDPVYSSGSVAAVGVAAHEAGHAVQYHAGYGPIKLRNAIIPATRFASTLSWPLILIGLLFLNEAFFAVGIALFSLSAIFQLVTLPVEFNASKRAIAELRGSGRLTEDELAGAKKVLSAAALTYVAALAVSIAQLLRILLIFSGRNKSNRR